MRDKEKIICFLTFLLLRGLKKKKRYDLKHRRFLSAGVKEADQTFLFNLLPFIFHRVSMMCTFKFSSEREVRFFQVIWTTFKMELIMRFKKVKMCVFILKNMLLNIY